MSKKLKDLTIRDNFMFAAVMMEMDNCKQFLEMVLGIEIERIEISYEKSIIYNPEFKGIRLDVYAKDEKNTCYDIEMQVVKQELGKRARYYHSQMDMELLLRGHDYEELPESYVIFICDFDPFGEKKYRYSFENRCIEDLDLPIRDGAKSIFLSTEGENVEEVTRELVKFLKFVKEDTSETAQDYKDTFVQQLQNSIQRVKQNREMERQYMLLEDLLKEERKTAEAKGKIEGELKAHRENIVELLEDLENIPDELHDRIMSETNINVLKHMFKAAVKADTLQEFEEIISNL